MKEKGRKRKKDWKMQKKKRDEERSKVNQSKQWGRNEGNETKGRKPCMPGREGERRREQKRSPS